MKRGRHSIVRLPDVAPDVSALMRATVNAHQLLGQYALILADHAPDEDIADIRRQLTQQLREMRRAAAGRAGRPGAVGRAALYVLPGAP